MARPETPTVNVYRGPKKIRPEWHGRRATEYESSWRELGEPSFDILLCRQIDLAIRKGKNTIVVLNLGADEKGFSQQILTNPSVTAHSRLLLHENPEFRIKINSLDDAKSKQEFLKPKQVIPAEMQPTVDNSQFDVTSIPYSVTTKQPLRNFLEELGIDEVNLAVSVGFLTYLKPGVFKQVLEDLTDGLATGGEAILFDYAGMAGSRLSIDDVEEDKPVYFRVTNDEGQNKLVNSHDLYNEAKALIDDKNVDNEKIAKMMDKIRETLIKADVFSIHNIFAIPELHENPSLKFFLQFMVENILRDGEALAELPTVRKTKGTILAMLQKEYEGVANIRFLENKGITIKKP